MAKILVADKLSPEGVEILSADGEFEVENRPDIKPDELLEVIGEFDALVVRSRTKVTSKVIERAKRLRVIGRAGVGLDNVDIPAATERGIIVMNTPGGNTISAAEHACSMILSIAKNLPQADASIKAEIGRAHV